MSTWDSGEFWLKAKLFIDRANEYDQASSDFAFWSALSLECLARSALTRIHPALNADPRDDVNLLYGFGFELSANPRSLPAHSVFLRLEKTVKGFGKPHRELCDFVALLRNAHLHTTELPYENLTPTKWLPRFYDTIRILNEFVGKSLEDFLGEEVAPSAVELIKALNDELLGAVKSKIVAFKKVFESKTEEERNRLKQAAELTVRTWRSGEKVRVCPACGSKGVLSGTKVKEFPEKYESEELLMDVQYLSTAFQCGGCGLSLKGVEEIAHAGLDTHFIETTSTSLHDLYEPEHY